MSYHQYITLHQRPAHHMGDEPTYVVDDGETWADPVKKVVRTFVSCDHASCNCRFADCGHDCPCESFGDAHGGWDEGEAAEDVLAGVEGFFEWLRALAGCDALEEAA